MVAAGLSHRGQRILTARSRSAGIIVPIERPRPVVFVTMRLVITYVRRFCHPGFVEALSGVPIYSSIAPERSPVRSWWSVELDEDRIAYQAGPRSWPVLLVGGSHRQPGMVFSPLDHRP
jgi:hypothetical protein